MTVLLANFWTLSRLAISFLRWGSHIAEQYSSFGSIVELMTFSRTSDGVAGKQALFAAWLLCMLCWYGLTMSGWRKVWPQGTSQLGRVGFDDLQLHRRTHLATKHRWAWFERVTCTPHRVICLDCHTLSTRFVRWFRKKRLSHVMLSHLWLVSFPDPTH